MATLYRIHWQDKETGRKGQGELIDGKKRAVHLVVELNINYPRFNHFLKEAREHEKGLPWTH